MNPLITSLWSDTNFFLGKMVVLVKNLHQRSSPVYRGSYFDVFIDIFPELPVPQGLGVRDPEGGQKSCGLTGPSCVTEVSTVVGTSLESETYLPPVTRRDGGP